MSVEGFGVIFLYKTGFVALHWSFKATTHRKATSATPGDRRERVLGCSSSRYSRVLGCSSRWSWVLGCLAHHEELGSCFPALK